VAGAVNKLGRFDAVIHTAGIGYRETRRVETEPGVPSVFAVNVLAPYILTALIERPDRLVYLSSGMHQGVRLRIDDLLWIGIVPIKMPKGKRSEWSKKSRRASAASEPKTMSLTSRQK
jgi:NAD(P)-dependent dehydrogenase (short-subunit alcohol dehydrogenase family)